MSTKTTRRLVLAGMAGGAALPAIPDVVHASDPVIALVNEADVALDAYLDAREIAHTLREKADNDPDRPLYSWEIAEELEDGSYEMADLDRQQRPFIDEHWAKYGVREIYDRWNAAGDEFRRKARFALNAPVVSVEGIAAKVQLISDIEEYDGDTDLVIEWNEWFTVLARDLGKIGGLS